MLSIPVNEQGEAVVSVLVIAAGLMKLVSDKAKKKVEEEPDETPIPTVGVEVIKKEDFDNLLDQVKLNAESIEKARNAFEDTLACITIINILLQVLASDRRKTLIKAAEEQVYTFIRHTDFPSRMMISTMFEAAVTDVNERVLQTEEKEKRNVTLDT